MRIQNLALVTLAASTALTHVSGATSGLTTMTDEEAQAKADAAQVLKNMPAAVAAIEKQRNPRDERGAKARRQRQAEKIAARQHRIGAAREV